MGRFWEAVKGAGESVSNPSAFLAGVHYWPRAPRVLREDTGQGLVPRELQRGVLEGGPEAPSCYSWAVLWAPPY